MHNVRAHKVTSKVHSFFTLAVVRDEWLNWHSYHLHMSLKIMFWYGPSSCIRNHSETKISTFSIVESPWKSASTYLQIMMKSTDTSVQQMS